MTSSPRAKPDQDAPLAAAADEIDALRAAVARIHGLAEALLEVAPPVLVLDAEGRVRGASDAAERLLGARSDQLAGRHRQAVVERAAAEVRTPAGDVVVVLD